MCDTQCQRIICVMKHSVNFQLGSLRMAQFVKMSFIVFRLARSIFRYYLNYCLRTQYTIPTNDLCHETCRVYVCKDDSEIEVLARSVLTGNISLQCLFPCLDCEHQQCKYCFDNL